MPRIQKAPEPKSRLKKFLVGCGIGCGSAAVLVLVIAAILYHQVTARPPLPAGVSEAAPAAAGGAPGTAGTPGVDASAGGYTAQPPPPQAQIDEIKRAAASGQPAPVSLRLTEGQINQLVADKTSGNSAVRNARIYLRSSDMVLTGTAMWQGREWYVTAMVTPQAVNGRLALHVSSVDLGRLALPSSAVARIQSELDRAMADGGPVGRDVRVDSVSIAGGELQLTGQTIPH